jgi:hypothetical protein
MSTQTGRIAANISAMNSVDIVALAFATFIVACKVVGELKDIELCALSVVHAGAGLSRGWRRALTLLGFVRRWMFLPMLMTTVPVLVLLKGGDVRIPTAFSFRCHSAVEYETPLVSTNGH